MSLPPIYFYLPEDDRPSYLPDHPDDKYERFGTGGVNAWVLQTYLRLRAINFPCELVSEFPEAGIVLAYYGSFLKRSSAWKPFHPYFENLIKPGSKVLLINLKADGRRYPYAQFHIVQNPVESRLYKNSYFIPHWSQPGLIPRCSGHGDRFENIGYLGHISNLASELRDPAWEKQLAKLGLRWCNLATDNNWTESHPLHRQWNDYSDMDAIVAIRSFGELKTDFPYRNKPATKLYNAWLAGIPAVLGIESAYRAEGHPNVDYLEVNSIADLITMIERLKTKVTFRHDLVKRGNQQAQLIKPEQTAKRWVTFLTDVAVPVFYRWCDQSRWLKNFYGGRNHLGFKTELLLSKYLSSHKIEHR